MQKLHIIDALSPFLQPDTTRSSINWSKIIFEDLEKNGRLSQGMQAQIASRFERFCQQIVELGYDSISIDDLAHLAKLDFYNPALQRLLHDYCGLYKKLFTIAKKHKLKLFINTDYLFFNNDIKDFLEHEALAPGDFFLQVLERAFQQFPEIDGIILRIGENDGKDVNGAFLSQLALRTPAEANQLLKKIVPYFEKQQKTLVFRTWTVGAHPIGDLIWNQDTYDAVFDSINSTTLVVSMKFGDTDFMRYLQLNPLFFRGPQKKIIELQARREWEGMGVYPSFVGWDYQAYFKQLAGNPLVAGVHVWCQTGGWAKTAWQNTTYLEGSSLWNELNTEITIALYKGQTMPTAIQAFCKKRRINNWQKFSELLELSEIAIKKGLYVSEIAEKSLYFRRTRIPSLPWLSWDRVLNQSLVTLLFQSFISNPRRVTNESDEAVQAAEKMLVIGSQLRLDQAALHSLQFQHDSLIIFARLRHFYLGMLSEKEIKTLNTAIAAYTAKYPQHYTIQPLHAFKPPHAAMRFAIKLLLREKARYRPLDHFLLASSPLQKKAVGWYLKRTKSHLKDQSMGVETLFQ